MSDFGSHVAVYRTDGLPPSPGDEERIRSAARSLQFTHKDRIGPYDGLDLRFGSASDADRTRGVLVGLTGYFVGDEEGNDGLDPDVIIAREEPVAEQFAGDLSHALGGSFRCEAYSGYW